MDISKLSTEDLLALRNKQYDKLSNEALLYLKDQKSRSPSDSSTSRPDPMSNINYTEQKLKEDAPNVPGRIPYAAGALGAMLTGGLSTIPAAAAGAGAASYGINKYQGNPEAGKQAVSDAIWKGVAPEVGGQVISGLGRGLGSAGDYLMQQAVGMKKYIPGVGKTLANEGVVGTKNMMSNQVDNALGRRGAEISDLSKGLESVSTDTPSQYVLNRAQKLVLPDGTVRPENVSEYSQLMELADSIAAKGGESGSVSGEFAAASRKMSGKSAKNAGRYRVTNPSEGAKAGMYGAEQGGWSQALKDSYSTANPGAPNALAEADQAYGALSRADQSLNVPESIPSSFGGMLHKAVPGIPLGASIAGRGSITAGNAAEAFGKAAPNTVRALQMLLSGSKE